jgi:hypothetical protein
MIREREAKTVSGYFMLFVLLIGLIASVAWLIVSIRAHAPLGAVLSILLLLADLLPGGLFGGQPEWRWWPTIRVRRPAKTPACSG